MNRYNPNIHHRRSIRLKGYDYSQAGLYFITIVTKNRIDLFGEIKNGKMILNDAGRIAKKYWLEIPDHFPNTKLHSFIIMPNHIHGIIEITVGAKNFSPLPSPQPSFRSPSKTIGSVVRGVKIGITKWFQRQFSNQYPVGKSIWQRNYWEHIIRNENEYNRITQYIINNPVKWENDKLNGGTGNIVMEPSAEYNYENWMV